MGDLASIMVSCFEVTLSSAYKVRVQQNFNKIFSLEI